MLIDTVHNNNKFNFYFKLSIFFIVNYIIILNIWVYVDLYYQAALLWLSNWPLNIQYNLSYHSLDLYPNNIISLKIISLQQYEINGSLVTPSFAHTRELIPTISFNMPFSIAIASTILMLNSHTLKYKLKRILEVTAITIILHLIVYYLNSWWSLFYIPEHTFMNQYHYFPPKELLGHAIEFFTGYIMRFEPFLVGFYLWVRIADTKEET